MNGLAVKPLTVDFHEGGFLDKLNQESKLGFWSQLSDEEKKQAGSPWGPQNPQALNRYSYVQNNPLKWTDPTGHALYLNKSQAAELRSIVGNIIQELSSARSWDVAKYGAMINAMFVGATAPLSGAAAIVSALILGSTTPFMNMDTIDITGNLEALKQMEALAGILDDYIENGGDSDTLALYMTMERKRHNRGPKRYTTEYRLNAAWGGKVHMSMVLDKTINQWANLTGRDNMPPERGGGPR